MLKPANAPEKKLIFFTVVFFLYLFNLSGLFQHSATDVKCIGGE